MKLRDVNDLPVQATAYGKHRLVATDGLFAVRLAQINAGQQVGPRMHLHRETMINVLRGAGTIVVGGKARALHPGAVCTVLAGEGYAVSNDGKIPLCLSVSTIGEYLGDDDVIPCEWEGPADPLEDLLTEDPQGGSDEA